MSIESDVRYDFLHVTYVANLYRRSHPFSLGSVIVLNSHERNWPVPEKLAKLSFNKIATISSVIEHLLANSHSRKISRENRRNPGCLRRRHPDIRFNYFSTGKPNNVITETAAFIISLLEFIVANFISAKLLKF